MKPLEEAALKLKNGLERKRLEELKHLLPSGELAIKLALKQKLLTQKRNGRQSSVKAKSAILQGEAFLQGDRRLDVTVRPLFEHGPLPAGTAILNCQPVDNIYLIIKGLPGLSEEPVHLSTHPPRQGEIYTARGEALNSPYSIFLSPSHNNDRTSLNWILDLSIEYPHSDDMDKGE